MSEQIAGEFNTTPATLASGQKINVQTNAQGILLTVPAAPSVGGGMTMTDKTITSATGSSQTLAAANAGRRAILIKNGATNAGINLLGSTAAIGGAATITLQPYEGIYFEGAACPVGLIAAITTSTNYISAIEYT